MFTTLNSSTVRPKLFFKTDNRLMQVKSIAEERKEHSAILSTKLSYHLSLRPLFCLFFSVHDVSQVLLYSDLL